MALSDSSNTLRASSIFELASGVETAACHLRTLFNCISQAVEDQDEALTLTLLESARHFVADVDMLGKALYAHSHRAQGKAPCGTVGAVNAEPAANAAEVTEAAAKA